MGRYLELAERAMKVRATQSPVMATAPHPDDVSSPDHRRDDSTGQGELWEERAAIMEVATGLPRVLAEAHAAVLCQPLGKHEPLEVGSRCPVCNRHLYVLREGRLWCVRCLRNARTQQALHEPDGEGR
jgi:hypothetical protein